MEKLAITTAQEKEKASVKRAKSSMKEGFGIFKGKIISKSSAWNDDLRRIAKR